MKTGNHARKRDMEQVRTPPEGKPSTFTESTVVMRGVKVYGEPPPLGKVIDNESIGRIVAEMSERLRRHDTEIREIKTLLKQIQKGLPANAQFVETDEEREEIAEMKTKVLALFRKSESLDYLDVIEKLKIKDIEIVIRIFDELKREGAIHAIST